MNRPAPHQLRLAPLGEWISVRDGDPDARDIFDRHYSRRRYVDGRTPKKFIGPGSYICLILPTLDALFVWRKFIDDCVPRQTGVNCAVFRNESAYRSSDLILQAEKWVARKWPSERRLYTYVDTRKIRRKRDPGRCFLRAGWRACGKSKGGKLILEKIR